MYLINLPNSDLKWLRKALNKKDVRDFCRLILVKNGYAYATNGYVAYRIETVEDQDGLYTFEGIKIDDDVRHPLANNSQKIFNDGDYHETATLTFINRNISMLKINEYYTVNTKYLYNTLDKTNNAVILQDNEGTRLSIEYDNRWAIIMSARA